MSNKKENIFFEDNFDKNVKPSKDIPGALISYSWRISENRCKTGELIALVTGWKKGTYHTGEILGKFLCENHGPNRWAIIYRPIAVGVFAGLHNVIKNPYTEKNYVDTGTFDMVVANPPYQTA